MRRPYSPFGPIGLDRPLGSVISSGLYKPSGLNGSKGLYRPPDFYKLHFTVLISILRSL